MKMRKASNLTHKQGYVALFAIMLLFLLQPVAAQTFIEEWPDGRTKHEGTYKEGLRVGKHHYYYENDVKEAEVVFSETGAPVSCTTWDEEGNLMEEIDYPTKTYPPLPEMTFESSQTGLEYAKTSPAVSTGQTRSGQKAVVHYAGFLEDGFPFESSWKRGKPFTFKTGKQQVIPGFEAAVNLLEVGETGWFRIQPEMGYRGTPVGNIPPHSTLVYKILLMEVK